MLKLTEKGEQLYDTIRDFLESDIDTLRLLYFQTHAKKGSDIKTLSHLVTPRKTSMEFLRSKGLTEGE